MEINSDETGTLTITNLNELVIKTGKEKNYTVNDLRQLLINKVYKAVNDNFKSVDTQLLDLLIKNKKD